MQQSYSKRQQFHQSIRKKQINELFRISRAKSMAFSFEQQEKQIEKEVSSYIDKRLWLESLALQMGSYPHTKWYKSLKKLVFSVKLFQGDFCDLLEIGIVANLVSCLRQENYQYGLSELAAYVLEEIFFSLPSDCEQVRLIMEYEFVLDLVQLCAPQTRQAINYYDLMNSMLNKRQWLRQTFLRSGIVQILASRLKMYSDIDSDEVFTALLVVYRLVKAQEVDGKKVYPNGNAISVFITILDNMICQVKRPETFSVVLRIFSCFASMQKSYITSFLFRCENMLNSILSVLTLQGNPLDRTLSARIICSIVNYKDDNYAKQLIRKGVLDRILECSRLPNNHTSCINLLLNTLLGIVSHSLEETESVLSHRLFGQFVIHYAKIPSKQVLETTVNYCNYEILQFLVKKNDLLEICIQSLSAHCPNVDTCLSILNLLDILVSFYNEISSDSHNRIILDLERFYNIQNVLSELEQKVQNQQICDKVSKLYERMYGQ